MRYFNQINPFGSFYEQSFITQNRDNLNYVPRSNYSCSEELDKPLIEIIAYCLNSNHYHLLVKQNIENGISKFTQKVMAGYTRYFNNKYNRYGSLFQGKFKAKEIKSTYGLIKLSIYVNCNAEIHDIAKKENWLWSSCGEYSSVPSSNYSCSKEQAKEQIKEVLSEFNNAQEYINFCNELIPEIRIIKNLEKYGLE
ncbi:MAG: transposase [Patescibacteria group bacterium]